MVDRRGVRAQITFQAIVCPILISIRNAFSDSVSSASFSRS